VLTESSWFSEYSTFTFILGLMLFNLPIATASCTLILECYPYFITTKPASKWLGRLGNYRDKNSPECPPSWKGANRLSVSCLNKRRRKEELWDYKDISWNFDRIMVNVIGTWGKKNQIQWNQTTLIRSRPTGAVAAQFAVIKVPPEWNGNRVSISRDVSSFHYSPNRRDQHWDQTSLLSNGYRNFSF
jgi:hypothetical protein